MTFVANSFVKFHGYASDSDERLQVFKYKSITDAMATILVDGYFNTYLSELSIGDLIYILATDGAGWYSVTSVTTNVAISASSGAAQSTVAVTSAELLALAAAPKTLVAAPGAGKVARFRSIESFLDFNTTAYTITNAGDDLSVRYTNGAGALVSQTIQAQGFLDATEDSYMQGEAIIQQVGDLADIANQALVLDNIGAAEYTLGDSPITVVVHYDILTVPS